MTFEVIFVSLFVGAWLVCGFLPWLVLSVATRGGAGLLYLPLSMFTGLVGGLAVPLAGKDDVAGIWFSFAVAILAPSLLLAARRFSMGAEPAASTRAQPSAGQNE